VPLWKQKLVEEFQKKKTMTAREIGKIVGRYGSDAVTNAKLSGLPIVVVGEAPRNSRFGRAPRLYALRINPDYFPMGEKDWTAKDGRSNSSDEFLQLSKEVARLTAQ
jgi:hypothetical protein